MIVEPLPFSIVPPYHVFKRLCEKKSNEIALFYMHFLQCFQFFDAFGAYVLAFDLTDAV